MHVIKLDAIGSTNDYLKELLQQESPENFTIVTAETQTSGRGQMGARWVSEPGKNLTMSILLRDSGIVVSQLFGLNITVATAVVAALQHFDIPGLSVKWPNDIMSGRKKIGGILIENSVRSSGEMVSVIGIGLNVNQLGFEELPQATSLAVASGKFFEKDEVLFAIAQSLRERLSLLQGHPEQLWEEFHQLLFRKGVPTMFENASGRFMGIIVEAGRDGKLYLQLDDDSIQSFGLKEVTMLY